MMLAALHCCREYGCIGASREYSVLKLGIGLAFPEQPGGALVLVQLCCCATESCAALPGNSGAACYPLGKP
jgi:hypothetical protein